MADTVEVSPADREECLRLAVRMIAAIRRDRSQLLYLAQTLDKMEAKVGLRQSSDRE